MDGNVAGRVTRQPELSLRGLPEDRRHQLQRVQALHRGDEGQLRVPPLPGTSCLVLRLFVPPPLPLAVTISPPLW